MKTRFYEFNQNNSGGGFDYDTKKGITHHVVIEANSKEEALDIAERIGLYFNGVYDEIDCPCCGDRWNTPWESTETPSVCGEPVASVKKSGFFEEGQKEIAVHYLDGRIEWFC